MFKKKMTIKLGKKKKKKTWEEPQGTDANYHWQEEQVLANRGSDLKNRNEEMRAEKEK